ncbi:MAG: fimbrillin family protein [Bacteroides sp.]|nr:fimbrillin family protein [Bacteroides sp.]MCM1389355.1 fimbrillin family protein [Bacteroides sp.]
MNANRIYTITSRCLMLPAIIIAMLSACSDSSAPELPQHHPSAISFRLSAAELKPSSRSLTYNSLETSITEGTLIGCVIAYTNPDGSPQYAANSAWEYHPDGLLLKKLFDADNNPVDINSEANTIILPASHPDAVNTAVEPSPYDLTLIDGHDYAFYFYYPYVDADIVSEKFATHSGNISLKTQMSYPNSGEQNNLSFNTSATTANFNTYIVPAPVYSTEIAGNSTTLKHSAWTKYPVATRIDYRCDDASLKTEMLNHSDFMYAAVTVDNGGNPINTTNSHSPIPVVMKKQMATIDLCFAENPSDIHIEPAWVNGKASMPRLKYFDLTTGTLSGNSTGDYAQWANGDIQKQCAAYASPIYPQYIGTSRELTTDGLVDYHVYRVILMPQAVGELNCDIKFTVGDKQLTLKNLQNNPRLASLKGGTYYKIRFSKLNGDSGWHLEIDDWEKGDDITLDRP